MSSKNTRGKRIVGVRGDTEFHAKISRIVAAVGVDKSTVVRTAVGWLSEEQIAAIITARHGQTAGMVSNGPQ